MHTYKYVAANAGSQYGQSKGIKSRSVDGVESIKCRIAAPLNDSCSAEQNFIGLFILATDGPIGALYCLFAFLKRQN